MIEIGESQSCCAVDEIIGTMDDVYGKDVIAQICNATSHPIYTSRGYVTGKLKLATHYVFTGVTGYVGGKKGPGYCQRLERYIKKNRLGSVVKTSQAPNLRHHKTHLVTAYLWTPNEQAVQKWWKNNKHKFFNEYGEFKEYY